MNHVRRGRTLPRALLGSALIAVALTAGAAPARASELLINGQAQVVAPQGTPLLVTLSGTPGAPALLLADVSPGPVTLFGHSLALGFTPAFVMVSLGPIPAGGTLSFTAPAPHDPALIGQTFYLLAAVADAPAPKDYDFSGGVSVHIADRNVQLAANPLPSYPHAEYPRAFNAGSPVSLAVDPAVHPELAGVSGDVYIVASRSRAGWIADPSLVDVRGAPTPVTLNGPDLAGNTITIDTGTLNGDAGTSVGVGYDMVLDLNGDGLLDSADPIDGFSDEAGFYVVRDLTLPGPLAVTEALYSGGTWLGQNLFYPTDIASLGELPLVVVSHGNGHNYQWYDHIGLHLASYGYIVMSHENNTGPGVETASTTTLTNTDYLLGNLDSIEGGKLAGHVDGHRIAWIGHSRGGEGVARAYDRLVDGTYVAQHFTAADIKLISSMAPTDFLGTTSSTPHAADYHLWVGGADNDVTGCAGNDAAQSFHLLDRAEGRHMSISLHGVGHGDFHNGAGSVASGPCLVGKPSTHTIMRGYLLPLVERELSGNVPAQDFLWRQWEHFRPIGAPDSNPCVNVDLQYWPGPTAGTLAIDDFQTNADPALSSSGGVVTSSVANLLEGRLDDPDTDFTDDGDAFNGFTEGRSTDTTRGIVFDFNGTGGEELVFELVPAAQDGTAFTWLSFRAAQLTRDPLTTAALGDLDFTVTLTDASSATSSIDIAAFGGGIEEPYQRTSCGIGTGWGNEFETVRIALADFVHDGRGLDLAHLATLSFRFGPGLGSTSGRLGLDDIAFCND